MERGGGSEKLTKPLSCWYAAILSTSKASGEGFEGHFGALKQKTGCFFGQKPFSTQLSLFSLDFFRRYVGGVLHFFFLLCAHYLTTSGIFGQGGERFSAPQKPQARGFKGILGP